MAESTCAKCGNTSFEAKLKEDIKAARYDTYFIQCTKCGVVVGAMDKEHISTAIEELDLLVRKKFDILQGQVRYLREVIQKPEQ